MNWTLTRQILIFNLVPCTQRFLPNVWIFRWHLFFWWTWWTSLPLQDALYTPNHVTHLLAVSLTRYKTFLLLLFLAPLTFQPFVVPDSRRCCCYIFSVVFRVLLWTKYGSMKFTNHFILLFFLHFYIVHISQAALEVVYILAIILTVIVDT